MTEPAPIEGTSWTLAALPGRTLVPEARPTARFERGTVSGTDGCNRYSMPLATDGSSITLGPTGPSTQMACPPEVMAQAVAFVSALRDARRYRVTPTGLLELLGGDGAVLAVLDPQAQTLAGTTWRAIAVNNGRSAVVGMIDGVDVTMTFGTDGRASGSAGCNQYTATYEANADIAAIRFGPAAATRRMCPDAAVMEQELAFLRALETVATMQFEGDRLDLRTADDALAVMLVRVP